MLFRLTALTLCVSFLAACAPTTAPLPTAVSTPTPLNTTAPTAPPTAAPATNSSVGYLAGNVTIGPLSPVERVGVPSPVPPPQVFTSRSINVFQIDGKTLVVNVKFNGDGTYRVALPPGNYVVAIARGGIDRARGLPQSITIESGVTTTLDINIDTGIR